MSTRKSMRLPIIVTFIIIVIMVYLFTSIKQSQVVCEKTRTFDSDVRLKEEIISITDGKKINSMELTKTIILPPLYADDTHLNSIKYSLEKTLDYLGENVKYTVLDDRIIVNIEVDKDEILLLNNIDFIVNDDLVIKINSNTKSSDVITLSVGDNYTDGELMTRLKNNGYSCK
ncbi:MAG: hypothetical protein IJI22_04405 [Bacilli bacterium]|nr:hypothetical protein [Bacilli bacterium]